jgi:Chemotaxis protein CheC, inhibitor of MCP methylation
VRWVMAISRYEEMNDMKLDIFKEMGSIGGGNAATALSSMLNARVSMALPRAEILEFNDALARLGDPEIVIAGVLVELTGEIQGIMLFIIPEEFSDEVLFRMLGKTRTALLELDEIESSVLTEIGNIVISSYVTALSSLAGVEVELSVPQLAVNMLGGIMSLPMAMMGQQSDRIMMVTGEFNIDDKALNSGMLLLPDVESLNILMKKLGVD